MLVFQPQHVLDRALTDLNREESLPPIFYLERIDLDEPI